MESIAVMVFKSFDFHMTLLHGIADLIVKQLVTQHMSVKNKLTNRSCGLATAVNDGKIY